jgi:deoxyhypusine synthase
MRLFPLGALMAHGLVEATGRAHFRYNPDVSDTELYEQGYNRVYDTLEPEQNLDDVEEVMSQILEGWDHNEVACSYKLNHAIGAHLAKHAKGQRGILKSAYENGVPVFVPAFTDSELGLDVALNNRLRESTGRHKLRFIRSRIWNILRRPYCGRLGWGFLLSAAVFHATGHSSSGRSATCGIDAWARTSR